MAGTMWVFFLILRAPIMVHVTEIEGITPVNAIQRAAGVPHGTGGGSSQGTASVPLSERITITVDDFAARAGISRATAWRRVRDGSVRVVRLGGRTLVPASEVRRIAEGVAAEARQ